jgi:hypothetical protein
MAFILPTSCSCVQPESRFSSPKFALCSDIRWGRRRAHVFWRAPAGARNARSDLNLKCEKRIRLALKGSATLGSVARKFAAHICGETLAAELEVGDTPAGWQTLAVDVDGEQATLGMTKV